LFFTPTAPLRPVSEGRPRSPDDDANQTYIQSLDWRWLNDILNDVPGECWVRPIVDLVKGESMLSVTEWLFLNTDLTVHIHRVPEGEWIGVQAENHYGRDGVGVSRGMLFDEHGAVAALQQAQLVRRR
jgi:hypothetical protein